MRCDFLGGQSETLKDGSCAGKGLGPILRFMWFGIRLDLIESLEHEHLLDWRMSVDLGIMWYNYANEQDPAASCTLRATINRYILHIYSTNIY